MSLNMAVVTSIGETPLYAPQSAQIFVMVHGDLSYNDYINGYLRNDTNQEYL